jgi:hypothetical protein
MDVRNAEWKGGGDAMKPMQGHTHTHTGTHPLSSIYTRYVSYGFQ